MMLAALSSIQTHLLDTEVDFEPRIETFWFAGGIERSPIAKRQRRRIKYLKQYADDPINIPVQYLGSPILQLRHSSPLREVISPIDCANPELIIPKFEFDPRVLGYRFSYRHATCIPGFWPGDAAEFGLLSYHSTNRSYFHSACKEKEAITVQAIFASYSWLLSQAVYQGIDLCRNISFLNKHSYIERILLCTTYEYVIFFLMIFNFRFYYSSRCKISISNTNSFDKWSILVILCISIEYHFITFRICRQ